MTCSAGSGWNSSPGWLARLEGLEPTFSYSHGASVCADGPSQPLSTDPSWLRDVQYRSDANLAARQAIYAYQHPRLNLPAWALELAVPSGSRPTANASASAPCCGGTPWVKAPTLVLR